MRKLNRFTFHEGTTDNPVVLSSTQIKTLVNMINDENFVYDFGGCVTSENGIFTKGEYNQLTFGGFNVIYTTLTPDEFSVEPVNPEINEGESTKLITNGIISKLVKFEISNVSVKDNIITNSEFKNRCSVDDNGVLHIAPAEENLDWEAEVNILAYPSYSSKAEGRSCTVKVNAVKITEIFFDSSVPEIVDKIIPTTLAIKSYPANNTKTYTVSFSAINGIIDGSFYSSNNNIEDTITATANVLGNILTVSKNVIVDDVILDDVLKNPLVFSSLKKAINLSDDVHNFKISDARQTTDAQVTSILKQLASDYNKNEHIITFNEFKYFKCNAITIEQNYKGISFSDLSEITFPDSLKTFNSFFVNTKLKKFNFNNCINKVNIGHDGTHYTFELGSTNRMEIDLSNTNSVYWGSKGNGFNDIQVVASNFIIGDYTRITFCIGITNLNFDELYIPNMDNYNVSDERYSNVWDSNSIVKNVVIQKPFLTIKTRVFSNLSKLVSINGFTKIPDNVINIGSYAFYNCQSITFNTLPPNIITIGQRAFQNCISIPYMDLSNCTLLYNSSNPFNANVFEGCINLTYIKLPNIGIVIPATNINSLPSQTIIYVPDNLVDSYKAATNWNSIESRIKGYSEM